MKRHILYFFIVVWALFGCAPTASGTFSPEETSAQTISIVEPDAEALREIDVAFPHLRDVVRSPAGSWGFTGDRASARPDEVRVVYLDIEADIYPTHGLWWFLNGNFDRHDAYGPLDIGPDETPGIWHASPQFLEFGDVIQALWIDSDGITRIATTRIEK